MKILLLILFIILSSCLVDSTSNYVSSILCKNKSFMIVRNKTLRYSVNRRKQMKEFYQRYKEKMKRYRTSCVSLYYDCIYGYYTLSDEQFTVIEEIIYNVLLS